MRKADLHDVHHLIEALETMKNFNEKLKSQITKLEVDAQITALKFDELSQTLDALKKENTDLKAKVQKLEKSTRPLLKRRKTSTPSGKGENKLAKRGQGNNYQGQRAANKADPEKFTSSYHGVYWNKSAKRWVSQIVLNGKQEYLGLYKTEEDAARAYDEKARSIEGKKINFAD